jgi:hypothetical protein
MSSARLHSLQALKDAKFAVAEFAESVSRTMASVDADINRITQWLTQDRPAHWKTQVRHREEAVAKVQADIMRKRIIAAPEPASIVEEQKALEKAKRRLDSAKRKLDAVRRWAPVWEREALLYKTSCRGLTEAVHRDMPAAGNRLDTLMKSIDAYLSIAVPRTDGEIAQPPSDAEAGLERPEPPIAPPAPGTEPAP